MEVISRSKAPSGNASNKTIPPSTPPLDTMECDPVLSDNDDSSVDTQPKPQRVGRVYIDPFSYIKQCQFDELQSLRDSLIESSYTFDYLRYMDINHLRTLIRSFFQSDEWKWIPNTELSMMDINDYLRLIDITSSGIDPNTVSDDHVAALHEFLQKSI